MKKLAYVYDNIFMIAEGKAQKYAYKLINKQYKTGPKLNNGGYGHVYYAQDTEGKKYALKICDLKLQNKSPQTLEKILKCLEKEDKFLSACKSQNIVKCYGALNDNQQKIKFIAMELCDLGSLEDLIYLKGHLTEQQAKIIFKQVLCGLSEIHREGLIHRDIKTSNVCFHENRCVICDFGCAKEFLTDTQQQDWRMTIRKNGTILGTILIRSPEMLGRKQYGYRTDMWGMGILLYEMITGIPPFWFNNDLSDDLALAFIKENIQNIYNENYIKVNIQKRYGFEMPKRGNYKISESTKLFLKKLIVFDQKERAGWKDLQHQSYLQQTYHTFSWELPYCSLPLKDVDWKMFIKSIQKYFKQKHKQKQQNHISNYKIANVQYLPQKLKHKEKLVLYKNCQQMMKNQKQLCNQIKIAHFEMRRLLMLINLRKYLTNLQHAHKNLKISKVGYMISKYCHITSLQLKTKILTNLSGFISQLGIQQLINVINPIYQEDKINFKSRLNGIVASFRSTFFYSEEVRQFYQSMKRQQLKPIYNYLYIEVQKLYQKIKKILSNNQIQYLEFFQSPKKILGTTYQPSQNGYWRQWHSFGCILQYVSSKKSNKN